MERAPNTTLSINTLHRKRTASERQSKQKNEAFGSHMIAPLPDALKTLTQPLHTYNKVELANQLEKYKISPAVFRESHISAAKIPFKPDPILPLMAENELSEKVLELQKRFKEQGPDNFSCVEFRCVIENIILFIEVRQPQDYPVAALDVFKEKLIYFLQTNEALPYKEFHQLCYQFIQLISASYFKNDTQHIERLNQVDYSLLFTNPAQLAVQLGDAHGSLAYFRLYTEYMANRTHLAWPSFAPLNVSFFVNSARYSINPLGILATEHGFHDHTLMRHSVFYTHDAAHAGDTLDHEDAPEKKQALLERLKSKMEIRNFDEIQKEAVYLLLFDLHHERGKCLLRIDEFSKKNLEDIATNIEEGTYELPENMVVEHLHEACLFLLDFIAELKGEESFENPPPEKKYVLSV